ncbi:ankyrin repeat domain-containing protein [Aquimarina algiphila]|uniref:Ankyrin repeat domain-containing protein n=2 Tax=Aquimarina algiphila TaxID=2047982 RepID=A0A554VA63_9FLAO|nr:ankyrin repeat domain-containing protein [Aquimarina algiphila]TSE02760.1 ankyrin repeat domain-containing protein [Aquimarina algiphila]
MSRQISRAMFLGDIEKFDFLIQNGYDIHSVTEKERWNLLHRALVSVTLEPKIEMITHLIKNGVDINGIDCYGYSPLHYAARTKNKKVAKCLLDAGAEINTVSNEGDTPLRLVFEIKPYDIEIVNLLLLRGVDMDHSNMGGASIHELVKVICWEKDDLPIIEIFDRYRKGKTSYNKK